MSVEAFPAYQEEICQADPSRPHLWLVPDYVETETDEPEPVASKPGYAEVIDLAAYRTAKGVRSVQEFEAPEQLEQEVYSLLNKKLGATALSASEVSPVDEGLQQMNLLGKLKEAAQGNEEAIKMVDANVGSALGEAMDKYGCIFESYLSRGDDGELTQFGQTWSSIYQNTVKMIHGKRPELQAIQKSEVNNAARIPRLLEDGSLDGKTFLAISLVPEGPNEDELNHNGAGYFMKTLSYNLQSTTVLPDGSIRVQTAFMKGVEPVDGEPYEARIKRRHDYAAIAKLYAQFGEEAPGTAAEILDKPLLIDNELMPNGVSDIMLLCDQAADEVLGRQVERSQDEYAKILEQTQERHDKLLGVRQHVAGELISEASQLDSPMEAVKRMWELIKDRAVEAAVTNLEINLDVFGDDGAAKALIMEARAAFERGDTEAAERATSSAKQVATVGGCGGGVSNGSKDGVRNSASGSASRSGEKDASSTAKSEARKRREDMPKHMGICRMDCFSHWVPRRVLCGPCNICMDCQRQFDDPDRPDPRVPVVDNKSEETKDTMEAVEVKAAPLLPKQPKDEPEDAMPKVA